MGMPRLRTLAAFAVALFMTLPVAAATVSVGAGGSLQAPIDNAAPGDTILLQAGAIRALPRAVDRERHVPQMHTRGAVLRSRT
jgi:nitrous oxidase accessory protein NosD